MLAALAWATVIGTTALADTASQDAHVLQIFREACVETGLDRGAFEELARERRWRRVRVTSSGDRMGGWHLMFRVRGGHVMLVGLPESDASDPSAGSMCSVSVERAPPSLQQEVTALAASLGLESDPMGGNFPSAAGPVRTWSRLGDSTLTYATSPDGRAVISLSRQRIISTVTSTSPIQP
ncbi:hypothetical protein [Brevundimonas sp.]|uniref:hypothetical protein n=1 Tax=Brevundimonas sp. TaxID=1871086 RepID=UPI001D89D4BE|nr:hypothetical protein [Brevundimonas sp.]MBL0947944.1 hypothetical protein [Brevundimonas sp.]